ncbi:MAG: noncanonical pyrimidine nucleotidase, YjjG family [Chlorobi bacterium]|nr:noncanonical pyrimidine nucleotidase, YjjG family [Chlorobiota bacterium]
MKKYKHIFFDLDHTLYDFERSTFETLSELCDKYNLTDKGIPVFKYFYNRYLEINDRFWGQYRKGKIEKPFLNVERFHVTFQEFGIDDRDFAGKFATEYVENAPLKNTLFPGAHETLEYLQDKYILHLITNGFEEVQEKKLNTTGLRKYFKTITTSEEAGVKKPDPAIFHYALSKAGAVPEESLMIGDNLEVDILGAKNVGMDQMFFNIEKTPHNGKITFEISELIEIRGLL